MKDTDEEPVSKKKKSGFAFRQERKKKQLIESAQHCTRITKFFSNPKKTEDNAEIASISGGSSTQDTACNLSPIVTESFEDSESEIIKSDVPIECNINSAGNRDLGAADDGQLDFNFYKKPAFNDLSLYLSFHPIQPSTTELPFIDKKNIFKSSSSDGQEFNRQWLTFDSKDHALFCYICVAFSAGNSVFCSGFKDWRHVHQRVQEHEESKTHRESVEAFMSTKHRTTTHDLLFTNQLETRKQQVMERRHVVGIVIDILKLIGKQGLPFRGSLESAMHLADESVNHGNFLEIINFVGKYDAVLQRHLEKVIENSRINHERADRRKALKESDENTSKNVGRGSFVSFIGKNTALKIIHILADEIRCQIAMDVKSAGQFSIMMDTTIDISTLDQCAFVVRFVKGCDVFERLLALKPVTGTSAEHLFVSLKSVLNESGISIEHCIANAFDGASNMSGQYNGVTAKLSEAVPQHIHTWCYSHVLNLVMCDTAECTIATISFFGLLQQAHVFFKESFKRLQAYLAEKPHFILEAIGATRWRSRSDAAVKIFGRIGMWITSEEQTEPSKSKCVYFELVTALFKISKSSDFNTKVRDEADALLKKFTSFETVFVAMMCLQIFKITTPVSDYLQTKNLDFSQAWRMVSSAIKRLKELRGQFKETVCAAKRFASIQVQTLDRKLEIDNTLESLEIEEDFKEKRKRTIKRQAGELCHHETPMTNRQDEVKVDVFFRVLDTAIQVMERRFAKHKDLYLDISWFDPRNFKKTTSLPLKALDKLCEHLPGINKGKLQEELDSFTHVWPKLKENISQHDYNEIETNHVSRSLADEFQEDEDENEEFSKCSDEARCTSCIKCVFKVIYDYNMYSLQYTELYKVYKYLLTLPMTQVTCERVFSKLKLIKTRLRSTLTDENLESLMLMSVERDILNNINNDFVISKLCETSSVMRRLLEV